MTDQKAMMEKLAEQFDALPEIWLQNELLEQTRDYLTRGRRFGGLKLDQLNKVWSEAFRHFVRRNIRPHFATWMTQERSFVSAARNSLLTWLHRKWSNWGRYSARRSNFPIGRIKRKIDEFSRDMNKPKH